MSGVAAPAAGSAAPSATPTSLAALLGIAAVLVGGLIASINVRLTAVGLADIRGGLALGFDEGSWFSTAFTAAQLGLCASSGWLSRALGPRRLLLWSCTVFGIASALPPLTRDPALLVAIQLVRGFAVGAFVPTTLAFILQVLAPRWWSWGLAAYAFRFVFSQNITDALEAFYGENGWWAWLFWQNIGLCAVMFVLIRLGMPRRPIDVALLKTGDWPGVIYVGIGLTLLYAGLDQGNRLDWLESGTVVALLAGGGLMLIVFVVHELTTDEPLFRFHVLPANMWIGLLIIVLYTFGSTATSIIVPDYLVRIQGLRTLQSMDVFNWIALPQLVLVPLVAWLLRRIDARVMLGAGLGLIAVGSWMNTGLTHDWASRDFLASQLVEAVGLAMGVTSLIFFLTSHVTPARAVTAAGLIQSGRVLGAEIGVAFIQTFVRVREQVASNLTGLNLTPGDLPTSPTTAQLSQLFADRGGGGAGDPALQSLLQLDRLVRREAFVLAYADGFWIVAWVLTVGLLLLLFLRPPPPNHTTRPLLRA